MDAQEIARVIEELERKCPPDAQQWLPDAFWKVVKEQRDEVYPELVRRTIEAAGRLTSEQSTKAMNSGVEKTIYTTDPGARERIGRDLLCTYYKDSILEARRSLIGQDEPLPRAEAVAFLKSEISSEHQRYREQSEGEWFQTQKRAELDNAMGNGMREGGRLESQCLEIPKGRGIVGARAESRLPTVVGSKLFQLAFAAERLSNRTGFDQGDIIWWVLTGECPEPPPRVRMREKRRYPFQPSKRDPVCTFILEINALDITWDELWSSYSLLRKTHKVKSRKISDKSLRTYELIQERGGFPTRGKVAFLKEIAGRLTAEGLYSAPPTRQAIEKNYERAKKRFEEEHRLSKRVSN